jgi:hypothetical protein
MTIAANRTLLTDIAEPVRENITGDSALRSQEII